MPSLIPPQWKLYIMLGAAAVLAGGSFTMGYRWEASALERYKLHVEQANTAATLRAQIRQQQFDKIATDAARREAATQAAMTANVKAQLAKVQRHVHNLEAHRPGCLTVGFVRVLDAAARGIDADTLVPPAGKSDDACAPADAAAVARSIVDNYGTARANAEQLDTLIDAYRQSQKEPLK